jgi:hypothetical protein
MRIMDSVNMDIDLRIRDNVNMDIDLRIRECKYGQ